MTHQPKPKVVFALSKFPLYDEAFILRELSALDGPLELSIFSLRKSRGEILHAQAESLMPRMFYVPYFFSRRLWAANLRILFTRPLGYLRALADLIAGNLRSPEFLIKNLIFFPKAVFLADWALKNKADHLFGHWATYPASVAMAASIISGIPFSIMGHAHDIYLKTAHLREKISRARFISTCTVSNKDYLAGIAPEAREKIHVIHHGLQLEKFSGGAKNEDGFFTLLSVGTLYEHKGHGYLIDAIDILRHRRTGTALKLRVFVIGGGPLEAGLRRKIEHLGLQDTVTLTGALKQEDVIPYYRRADLLVLMAQSEWHWGIPNVILEALAAKAAVITTRFGSVEEVIKDGASGLLVPSKDANALASCIEKLYKDRDFLSRLADAGYQKVAAEFDLKQTTARYVELFTGHETRDTRQGGREKKLEEGI